MALAEISRHRFTVEEYHRMGELGLLHPDARVELIEGEILDMSPVGRLHASVVNQVSNVLKEVLGRAAIIQVQSPVTLSDLSEPEPDVTVLAPDGDYYRSRLPGAADAVVVIEVSQSSLRYDLDVKLPLYARSDVREAWVADPVARTILVATEPGPTGYGALRTCTMDDGVSVLGIEVSVRALLGTSADRGDGPTGSPLRS